MAVVFGLLGLYSVLLGKALEWWPFALAAVFLVLAFARPDWLALPNRLWMRFGELLHGIVSPMVLAVLFFGVVTPIGLAMRLSGKDPMGRRPDPHSQSYWIKREPPGPEPSSMKNQF